MDIRDWTLDIFNELAPDYFWKVPASKSGKYHPALSLGEGGLVRHTKLAVWWGLELYKMLPDDPGFTKDEVIACLLLHDLLKYGEDYNNPMNDCVRVHGVYFANTLSLVGFSISEKWQCNILDGIYWHMGKWTKLDDGGPAQSRFTDLIHLADYCASRKVDDKIKELVTMKKRS
jgi:hypothetical protein